MRALALSELDFVAGGPPENPPADKGPEPVDTSVVEASAEYLKAWWELAKAVYRDLTS